MNDKELKPAYGRERRSWNNSAREMLMRLNSSNNSSNSISCKSSSSNSSSSSENKSRFFCMDPSPHRDQEKRHLGLGKNAKAWTVSPQTGSSKNTKAWAVSQLNIAQQEHQGLGCLTIKTLHSKNVRAWAVSQLKHCTARTSGLGLSHN